MGRHISDSLYPPCRLIMGSDDDQPIVMEIYAGFNNLGELVICVDRHDYEMPEYNCSTAAVVHPDDSPKMARKNRVKHDDLPIFIADCMADWGEIVNPTLSQVRNCFKEITECLLYEGCRFRIIRTYGKKGNMCC